MATMAEALQALDRLLALAIDEQTLRFGPDGLHDPWHGMHLSEQQVRRLLDQDPPALVTDDAVAWLARCAVQVPRWQQAARAAGLDDLDLALLLLIAAPDLDLRYERLYGYLQDDLNQRRPGPDLLAKLLSTSLAGRLGVLDRLQGTSALNRRGLIRADGSGRYDNWLACGLRLDSVWLRWLQGLDGLDQTTAAFAELLDPATLPLGRQPLGELLAEPELLLTLQALLAQAACGQATPRLLLQGPHGAGKLALAHAVAQALSLRLLVADVSDADDAHELTRHLHRAATAAWLGGALLCVRGSQALAQRDVQLLQTLSTGLAGLDGPFVVLSSLAWPTLHGPALSAWRLSLALPPAARRQRVWAMALQQHQLQATPQVLVEVAARFALCAAQIAQAVTDVALRQQRKPSISGLETARSVDVKTLAAAARAQSGGALQGMAQRITPRADFNSLVCASDTSDQLREICSRVATRERVRAQCGGSAHARSVGISALFAGASGTGKTLAAEALACELELDLMRIDLAGIVSKYIGETEKNLDRVFTAALHTNAVLFFDEADALFGKRSEVKDARDRYANIEVAYLLQKMEQFDGLAILATNLKQNLDEAFARRLTFSVNFAFPEAGERLRLWQAIWPAQAPRADDIDLAWFAQEFRLSGGNIRNAVMAAVHLAAADDSDVRRRHLMHAVRREYQKLGKNLVDPQPPVPHAAHPPQRAAVPA